MENAKFSELSLSLQIEMVLEKGKFISKEKFGPFTFSLYRVEDFYYELTFETKSHLFISLHRFDSSDKMPLIKYICPFYQN
ncbi:MAG: hypothetical protein LAT68_07080 [Cyclobacteriaceae bacterium]|nr:hypothetical protein [Cyclobacteriaceae bacterium]MCH8516077.1 hypothetical protein [Cyclobacteriaceae bacterium]